MDRIVFVEGAAEFRLEGGLVRVEMWSGGVQFHIAMSIHTFLASFRRSAEIAKEWRGGAAEVVKLRA